MPFVRMNKGKNPGIHGKVRDTEELKSAKGMVSDFGVYTSLINEFVKKKLIYMVKVPYWAFNLYLTKRSASFVNHSNGSFNRMFSPLPSTGAIAILLQPTEILPF
ncbi:hypothetical protein ACJX0J_011918 [Zea mays]